MEKVSNSGEIRWINHSSYSDIRKLDSTDKWILSSLNRTINCVNESYSKYRMNDAVKNIYNFATCHPGT